MKKIKEFGFYGLLLMLLFVAGSCNKAKLSTAELLDNEQTNLKQYLQSHNITTAPTASGIYYIPKDTSSGIHPDTNDVVEMSYTLRLINGQVISTNIDSVARANNIFISGVYYRPFQYRVLWWIKGLQEGLTLMHEGGNATIIIPSQLAYGSNGIQSLNIGGYTTVIFDIHLVKVIHDPIAYEKALMDKFVQDSVPLKTFETLDSGVYHIIDVPGTGNFPINGNTISLHYIAKLIDGTLIEDHSAPNPVAYYVVGSDYVIKGFEIAMRHMKKGEKAWIIIPYKQAYNEQPPYYINLPTFSTLLYYITIEDIQ
jgi:FKBP-type peptidyl-prolyl cis-trans isomerase FkpA